MMANDSTDPNPTSPNTGSVPPPVPWRIGHGYDVHRFGDGDHLVMGGVRIPFDQGFIAHSDGDVLIHALCDALLGSIAAGDIGRHFPDDDEAWNNIDSTVLLNRVCTMLIDRNIAVANIDVTIIAQAPKMSPFIDDMRTSVANCMKVGVDRINIKATTTEKLGFQGRGEGIAVHAVVLVYSCM